jgi:hypothetical protein
MKMEAVSQVTSLIRDIGLIIGVPTIIIVGANLYEQQINVLKEQNELLKQTQYDRAWAIIKSQKDLFENERQELLRRIQSLAEKGANYEVELQKTRTKLSNVDGLLEIINSTKELDRYQLTDGFYVFSWEYQTKDGDRTISIRRDFGKNLLYIEPSKAKSPF